MASVHSAGKSTLTRKPSHIIVARTKPFFRRDTSPNSNKRLLRLNDFRTSPKRPIKEWISSNCEVPFGVMIPAYTDMQTLAILRMVHAGWPVCEFYPSCAAVNRFSGNWIKFPLLFDATELEVSLQYKHTYCTVHMNWIGDVNLLQGLHVGYGHMYLSQGLHIGYGRMYLSQGLHIGYGRMYLSQGLHIGYGRMYLSQGLRIGYGHMYLSQGLHIGYGRMYLSQGLHIGYGHMYLLQGLHIGCGHMYLLQGLHVR
jgi:hypothetical protein